MSFAENPYSAPSSYVSAAEAAASERASFIVKTYSHLMGAIIAFVGIEAVLLNMPFTDDLVRLMMGGRYSWLVVLGMFMGVSWLASSWAQSSTSLAMQYLGLGVYVVAEAIIFVPILYLASLYFPNEPIIPLAGITTVGLFAVLSSIVFVTRANFSFLRSVMIFGSFAIVGLIVCSLVFNFELGILFTYGMIAFACASILYQTSNVLHEYRIGQHVAASLALFASVALLFWYILQLFMSRD